MNKETGHSSAQNTRKQPKYIDGVGWRYETEHRMTRWPEWKNSRLPGTYMFTLNINGGQRILGRLEGSSAVVRQWMKEHPAEVQAASNDDLYYRHAMLGTRAMPFVLTTPAVETAANKAAQAQAAAATAQTAAATAQATAPAALGAAQAAAPGTTAATAPAAHVHQRFDAGALPGSATATAIGKHRKTHFPLEALRQPGAPHIVLSPLGQKVKAAWERMPSVVPEVEQVTLAIMPNHIHAIIAVKRELPRAVGAVIRSFMGVTSHTLHQMMNNGEVSWNASRATITKKASAEKPSLWEENYCVGVCQTEKKLHTRLGYVIENPFFGVLEQEEKDLMQRVLSLSVAGRTYAAYGNLFLLKEPDKIQVFCHRKHPKTGEPYHLTPDFQSEKTAVVQASNNGAVVVTPGISPGEKDIMWSVLRNGGSVISIQKEEIPLSQRWHPDKERRLYCSQGKLLVLSVHDLPHQVFRNHSGEEIPADSKYVRFHLLNLLAAEICTEGIEHKSFISRAIIDTTNSINNNAYVR